MPVTKSTTRSHTTDLPADATTNGRKASIRVRALLAAAGSLAIFALLGVAGAPSAGAATATWRYSNTDADSCWEIASIDRNFNGYAEEIWADVDNDCRWDTRQLNTYGHDSFHEAITFDMNENGRPEMWVTDTNQRTGFEWAFYDTDQNGYANYRVAIGVSTTDELQYLIGLSNGQFGYSGSSLALANAALRGQILY